MRISDWSSDVCSSDLPHYAREVGSKRREAWRYAQVRDGREGEVRQQRRKNRRQADHACCQRQAGQREGLTSPAGLLDALAAVAFATALNVPAVRRSEEHTSELQSLMRNQYDDYCLK